MTTEDLIKMCEELIMQLENRLEILEGYRNMDIDKEILDTLNDIRKYKNILKELYGKDN